MHNDSDAILDDLLIRWHQWRQGYTPSRGFNDRSLVTGDYQISRQYDDANGALDDAIETTVMRQVEFEISELPPLEHIAICVLARALVVGSMVFMSPRLPADRHERDELMRRSRTLLTARLLSAGVM